FFFFTSDYCIRVSSSSRGLGDVYKGVLLYSLIGTCKLNGVEPESYLRYVLDVIADWPINRVGELLPWRVALPTE
ncbi:transposase domain-containing protein, partial [Escherichia coli]|uniref:transposase domain-containing protein n=1 Tax=Escherichia coli TaxID=562 RepID=UPI0011EA1453